MAALEVLTGTATAPGATLTAATMAGGDSLTIRNFNPPARAFLLTAWGVNTTTGKHRIRSPRMHDNVNNITATVPANVVGNGPKPSIPLGQTQELQSQDTLILEIAGGGAGEIDLASLLVYYQDVPGVSARFIDEKTYDLRAKNTMTMEAAIVAGVTGPYSGSTALTTFTGSGNWKANVDYALLGALVSGSAASSNVGTVGIRGVDSGNVRLGIPGNAGDDYPGNWFMELTRRFQIPLIPVFNAANKAGIIVDLGSNEVANTVTVTLIWAELA